MRTSNADEIVRTIEVPVADYWSFTEIKTLENFQKHLNNHKKMLFYSIVVRKGKDFYKLKS